MEPHGGNPKNLVVAIIPARYASVRLPAKMLHEIAGKPLIVHTLERALTAKNVSRVIVATDDERIVEAVTNAGGEAVMTSAEHLSGSDRIAEVAETLPKGTIVVNVQGDEPLISSEAIDLAVEALMNDSSVDIATTCEKFTKLDEVENPNNVKVVTDQNGIALYFSRSPIPFVRDGDAKNFSIYRKHTGLYVYRREYLLKFSKMKRSPLEIAEMLEQLRALEDGAKIKVIETSGTSIAVDTLEDLENVRKVLKIDEN